LGFGGVLDDSTKAEIAEFGNSLLEQDICGLDISMDDVFIAQGGVAVNEMSHEG
jgi:hypothetical protein